MIERARPDVGDNAEFFVVDGERIPRPDGSVTALFSTHVLQYSR
jgi:hypothetical protein